MERKKVKKEKKGSEVKVKVMPDAMCSFSFCHLPPSSCFWAFHLPA